MPAPVPAPASVEDRRSPFIRLAELLAGIEPGRAPLSAAVGEPQHTMPDFVGPVLAGNLAGFGRYPRAEGTPTFRAAAARWLERRYALARPLDADREVLALNGSREGLFSAAIVAQRLAAPRKLGPGQKPAMLLPNPFYAAYAAGAEAAGCEAVVLPTTAASGWLPDLDALDPALLDRTVAIYLASPANPQGAIASTAYLERALELARRHGAFLFSDECYSEIYLGAGKAGRHPGGGPGRLYRGHRLQLPVQALFPARTALRLLRRRCRLPQGIPGLPLGGGAAGARAAAGGGRGRAGG